MGCLVRGFTGPVDRTCSSYVPSCTVNMLQSDIVHSIVLPRENLMGAIRRGAVYEVP